MGVRLISEKTETLYTGLNERAEAAASSYSVTGIFRNIFILCLWLRIIRTSDQGVSFMNFPSQIFFNDINHGYKTVIMEKNSLWLFLFYMAVATFMKSFAERYALQLYHAFLKRYSSAALYCEILTTAFFTEYLWWLLLYCVVLWASKHKLMETLCSIWYGL